MNRMAKVAGVVLTVGIAGMFAAPAQATAARVQAEPLDGILPSLLSHNLLYKSPINAICNNIATLGISIPVGCMGSSNPDVQPQPQKMELENNVFLYSSNANDNDSKAKNDNDIDPKAESTTDIDSETQNKTDIGNEAKNKCDQDDKGHKKPCRPGTDAAPVDAEADTAAYTVPAITTTSIAAADASASRAEH
jgi:hypothetical protein